jgi:16S rRNA (guanine1207-N2)-methyltransferase
VPQDHYFSATPSGEARLRPVSFSVADQELTLNAAAGTFSSEKLDKGTAVLLKLSNRFPSTGRVLDLGCGWGPIGISIAKLQPGTEVWAVDVNSRSVELANQNSKELLIENFKAVTPEQLPTDLKFNEIWSNPPIRIGKPALHQLLMTYLERLTESGRAMLVVQKQLGAESLLSWLADQNSQWRVTRVLNEKGYWVIEVFSSPKSP